jgi:hypothetical protein
MRRLRAEERFRKTNSQDFLFSSQVWSGGRDKSLRVRMLPEQNGVLNCRALEQECSAGG